MIRRILILTIVVVIGLAIGQEAEADWLGGWDNRIKLTIDHNDITSNLSNFPILIYLSDSSGRNSDDVSCVFDELTSDANRKKIAVTKSNGTTQCYVEIEKWDNANEQAWLWVRVSGTGSISSSVDTVLYLYYDKDQTDNTSYVGDSGSTIARNVWDGSSRMVQHLDETDIDGGSGDIKDSTFFRNNGTTKNMNTSDQVPGQIDGSFDFDGSNDYIYLQNIPFPSGNSPRSVSFWINDVDVARTDNHYIFFYGKTGMAGVPSTYNQRFSICIDNARGNKLSVIAYGADYDWAPYVLPTDVWKHVAFTFDGSTITLYIDGSFEASTAKNYNTVLVVDAYIGVHEDKLANFKGMLDELRISNTARSAAWIKASYESGKDHLLDFGSEEAPPDPELSVNPLFYDFGDSGVTLTITVTNTGGGTLNWSANEGILWLSLNKSGGSLSAGSSENVAATVNRTGQSPGSYSGIISFTSSYGNPNVIVWMTVPEPDPELSVNPISYDFGDSGVTLTITVTNTGGGTLNWSVSESLNWLSLNKSGGSLSAGSSENVTATVDRTGQSPGSYNGIISFTSIYGSPDVTVWMTVPEPDPELSVNPISYDFGTSGTSYQFTITNTGGGTLNWSVSEEILWLSLDKDSGSLSAGSWENVTATVNRTGQSPGSYIGIISFTSSYGKQDVIVLMSVPEPDPELSVNPISYDFGTSGTSYQFTITNTGGGTLNWSANEGILWLSLNKDSGSLSAGSSENVTATVNRTGQSPGSYNGIISFTSIYGSPDVTVWMSVPEPDPELSVNPISYDFGDSGVTLTITVTNTGGGTLNWSANEGILWLSLNKDSGSLSAGSSENVTATVDRTGQSPGSYSGIISFTSNGGSPNVTVWMTVPESDPELSVNPPSYDFGTSGTSYQFTVTNTGGGTLNWSATCDFLSFEWLSLDKDSGSLSAGSWEDVTAIVDRTGQIPGSYNGIISFTSIYGSPDVTVWMTVPGSPYVPTNLGPINYVDGSWGNNNAPTLEFTQSDPNLSDILKYTIQIDINSDFSWPWPEVNFTSELLLQGATSYTCPPLSDGTYYWQVMSTDNSGESSGWSIANDGAIAFKVDTTPPTGTILINDGDGYTNSTSVTLTLSASDAGSGISKMRFSNDGVVFSSEEDYATSKAWALTAGDGPKTVYVQYKDTADNWSDPVSAKITLETIPPTGTISINNGYGQTNSTSVILNLWAEDSDSGVGKMKFSNDGVNWSGEEYYATSFEDWTLTADDGTKTVYVQYKDNAGNWSTPPLSISDTIIMDTQKPTVTLVVDNDKSTILPDGEIVGVLPDTGMEAKFSKVMNTESVKGLKLIAVRDNLNSSIDEEVSLNNFEWDSSTKTVSFNPQSGELKKNYLYSLKVTEEVKDLAGNTVKGEREIIFRTIMDYEKNNVVIKWSNEKFKVRKGTVTVTLEANALTEDGYLIINTEPLTYQFRVNPESINVADEKNIAKGWYPIEGCLWEIKVCKENGDWMEDKFGSEVKITFPYDEDNGVVWDAPIPLREETLLAFWLNEEHSNWVRVPGSRLDRENNVIVTGKVPGFSVFGLMGSAVYDLSNAHAYPVPWKPNDGKDGTGSEQEGITFTKLSAEGVIKIYTISGELVREYDYKPADTGKWTWDVKTSRGEKVFSGVYIYYIKNEKEQKKGRLMIIR